VADNTPDDAGDFVAFSNGIIIGHLPAPYITDTVYLDDLGCTPPTEPATPCPAATAAIIDSISEGRLLVNYIGHAGNIAWAHEVIFRADWWRNDISSLTNEDRLPMLLSMACATGYYHDPDDPCIDEQMVWTAGRGAIATFSPTGFGCADGHDFLNRGFFDAVFKDDVRAIGPATTAAKVYLCTNSGCGLGAPYRDLMDTYVLLGDPAMELNVLPANVEIDKAVEPPGPVHPGDRLTYTLAYANAGPATAHHVVITDLLPVELESPVVASSGAVITPRLGTRFAWDVEDLAETEGGTIIITAVVSPTFVGVITNSALIETTAKETDTSNAADVSVVVADPDAVIVTIAPQAGGTLTFIDPQGLATTVDVPPGAANEEITLVFTPIPAPPHPTPFQFAGHAFNLEVYVDGKLVPGFTFLQPIDITIHYSDEDVAGLDESLLMLERWNGAAWEDAACGAYDRHPQDNWLSVPVCHLTEFALLGDMAPPPVGGFTLPPKSSSALRPISATMAALIAVVAAALAIARLSRREREA
jgi:uncharacterized repeat protein (TIGR01451 family)